MYKLSETVRSTHSQDGAVVLDIRQGEMFNLNLVGSRILELLKRGSTEAEVVDEISRQFNADRAEVERDVQEFVVSLQEHRLIVDTKPNGRK
jgi:hypothetical protein